MTGRIKERVEYDLDTCERRVVKVYLIDGKEVAEEEFLAVFPDMPIVAGTPYKPNQFKPIHSEAVAVHPKRRQEAIDDAVKKGVPTEFDPMGRPVFRSRQHRREYLRVYGFHDNASFYGY